MKTSETPTWMGMVPMIAGIIVVLGIMAGLLYGLHVLSADLVHLKDLLGASSCIG